MAITINGDTGISSIGALSGVTSVSSAAADTPVILQDSSSNSNTCRAWVNFNGTGTVAIRADFNVSSITDNGTGDYTVNLTNATPNTNYTITGTAARNGTSGFNGAATTLTPNDIQTARTTSAFRIALLANGGDGFFDTSVDSAQVNVAIFS